MAPPLFTHLVGSLTRQLAHLTRYAGGQSTPAAGLYRCLSAVAALRPRELLPPGLGRFTRTPVSLLGQCQRLVCAQQFAGMKTKTALKKRCKDCFFVRRRGRLFVFCKTNHRHKQRQG